MAILITNEKLSDWVGRVAKAPGELHVFETNCDLLNTTLPVIQGEPLSGRAACEQKRFGVAYPDCVNCRLATSDHANLRGILAGSTTTVSPDFGRRVTSGGLSAEMVQTHFPLVSRIEMPVQGRLTFSNIVGGKVRAQYYPDKK